MDTFSPVLRSRCVFRMGVDAQSSHQLSLREAFVNRSLNFRVPVTAVWYVLAS